MKFKQSKMTALATGVALGVAGLAAQASDGGLTELGTFPSASGAKFASGATINGGVSYLPAVPSSEPADLVMSIHPDPADVGEEADIYAVLRIPGLGAEGGEGWFQRISGGIWVPWDTQPASLQPYTSMTLQEHQMITVIDGMVGDNANMAGMTIDSYVAYAPGGDLSRLTFNTLGPSLTDADGTPAQLSIAEAAGDSCPENTMADPNGQMLNGKAVCLLTGMIDSHTHLTSNFAYVLDGKVSVGVNDVTANEDKVRLTINAGTTVYAQQGGNHYLHIDRGGQLHANGNREKPVVFTYVDEQDADESTTGQWGGIVLNGSAPTNVQGDPPTGEGGSGEYGGDRPEDSSGVLTFTQVRYAGYNFNEEDELNGIAFQGTGSGTLVDYIQVHNNADDGVEFFGGTTSARHVLLTGNEDDALDWTQGWNGNLQFVAIRQTAASEHCIEADSNSDNNDNEPRAKATISNITCAGPPDSNESGFRLREGTSAVISNAVIGNFGSSYCVDIDDPATFTAAGGSIAGLNGSLTLSHSRLAMGCNLSQEDGDPFNVGEWFAAQAGSMEGGVDLGGDSGLVNGHMLNSVMPMIPNDPFFEQVDYIGAIKDETSDWTAGWSYSDWD